VAIQKPAVAVEPAETLDIALLQRIVARDQTAVAELYDRHSAVMFSVILRILRNASDAEEVLQEVFVRVWTRAATYDERLGAPAAWLTRMARNRAIDRLRSKRTRSDVDAPEAIDAGGDQRTPASTVTPEQIAGDKERTATVRAALEALPVEQRMLIAAAFFDGYTHSELAAHFGLPLGTVKTRIRSGMLALREHLEHRV
jgi:RNA polymerase sigma-70 factor, ECF subfamily